jgi:hypothetical protein
LLFSLEIILSTLSELMHSNNSIYDNNVICKTNTSWVCQHLKIESGGKHNLRENPSLWHLRRKTVHERLNIMLRRNCVVSVEWDE